MFREFYTYAYLRKDKTPYYIGKGKGSRAWSNCGRKFAKRPKDPNRILILKQNLTEEEAFKHEIYMIAVFGRKDLGTGILLNMTNGGEGNSGGRRSEEVRRKISEATRGRKFSSEHKRKLSEANSGKRNPNFGKTRNAETRAKIAATRRKRCHGNKGTRTGFYIFTSPQGEDFAVTGRFKAFCCEQGIIASTMWTALRRGCSPPPNNGWKVCYAGGVSARPSMPSTNPPSKSCAMSDNLFIIAARRKFRFASEKGDLNVEQLWDLPLKSRSGFDLDTVAISVNNTLKGLAEESFVGEVNNPLRDELEKKLRIVKFIIATKQDETKAASERLARQAMRRKLQEAIEAKEDQALVGSSIEELKAQLAALS